MSNNFQIINSEMINGESQVSNKTKTDMKKLNLKNAIEYLKGTYYSPIDWRKVYELATDERKAVEFPGTGGMWLVGDDEEHYEIPVQEGRNKIYVKPCYIVFTEYGSLNPSSAISIIHFWLKKVWKNWRHLGVA